MECSSVLEWSNGTALNKNGMQVEKNYGSCKAEQLQVRGLESDSDTAENKEQRKGFYAMPRGENDRDERRREIKKCCLVKRKIE